MPYVTDTMRVEMSLPIHVMLAILLTGANCADPGPKPAHPSDWAYWQVSWAKFKQRLETDQEFARSYETFKKTKALLMEACEDALFGAFPKRKELALLRRIERVHVDMIQPLLKDDKADPRKIGIIAYYLLQHLVDHNTIIIPPDSAFGEALNYMLPALSPPEDSTAKEDADYEALNRSARKQVRKIVLRLQEEGYYQGIPLPDFQG